MSRIMTPAAPPTTADIVSALMLRALHSQGKSVTTRRWPRTISASMVWKSHDVAHRKRSLRKRLGNSRVSLRTPATVPLGDVGKSVIPGCGSFFHVQKRLSIAATNTTKVTGGRMTPTMSANADTSCLLTLRFEFECGP